MFGSALLFFQAVAADVFKPRGFLVPRPPAGPPPARWYREALPFILLKMWFFASSLFTLQAKIQENIRKKAATKQGKKAYPKVRPLLFPIIPIVALIVSHS